MIEPLWIINSGQDERNAFQEDSHQCISLPPIWLLEMQVINSSYKFSLLLIHNLLAFIISNLLQTLIYHSILSLSST